MISLFDCTSRILFRPARRTLFSFMDKHSSDILDDNINYGRSIYMSKRPIANSQDDGDDYKKIKREYKNMAQVDSDLISKHNFVIEDTPVKSPSDSKQYLAIKLSNGLRALLISDVNNLIDLDNALLNDIDETSDEVEVCDNELNSDDRSRSPSDECSGTTTTDEDCDSDLDDVCREIGSDSKLDESENKEKLAACALTVGVGSFSDTEEIPGLAHFMEHMIFMGSKKYPKENDFDSYINTRGGSDNASTECEYTSFYFDCPEIHFEGALDIFSNFFISPLMNRDSISREREAIESEFKLQLSSDSTRCEQLFCSTAPLENPVHKFMWGNLITLQVNVNEDVLYSELHKFWQRHYSAHRITVAIQARLPMNTLVDWVATHFGEITTNNLPPDSFPDINPPFKMELFNKIYTIQPIKDINKLHITWALPSVQKKYQTKPLSYLSYLIGHEGDGSLLAHLHEKLWALSVTAGNGSDGIENNSIYSLFTIEIDLTDEGLLNIDKLLHLVFSYITLLKNTGPVESIFRETELIDEINFSFLEEVESLEYVEDLSQTMQVYPSVDYIRGDHLLFRYDPEDIISYLNLLTPDKVNIMILSKSAAEKVELDNTEKWFNTKFNMKDIPEDWLLKWTNCDSDPNFYMPNPNQYIASDFKILNLLGDASEYPRIILKNDYIESWHKQDTKFQLPNTIVKIYMVSPIISILPQNSVMADIFVFLFALKVSRGVYPALLAGLGYSLIVQDSGLMLTVQGYNEKLPLLVDTLLKKLATFMSQIKDNLFDAIKEQIRKRYYNRLLKVSTLSTELRLSILCKPYWTSLVKLEVLPQITLQKLQEFNSQFFENLYVKCLFQGNIDNTLATEISMNIMDKIKYKPLTNGCYPDVLVRKLPLGETVLRVQSFNNDDPNCNITNYYQCGLGNVEEYCKVDLLMMIMQEPLFDTLRTQEQLGYDINCDTRVTNGILGFSVTVKSQVDKHKVDYVENRITKFLNTIKSDIKKMTLSDFNQVKESMIILKQQADNDLKSEVKRNWSEIITNEYMFDRNNREVKCIENFKCSDIADYFHKLLKESTASDQSKGARKKRGMMKLSVQIDSEQDPDESNNDLSEASISDTNNSTYSLKIKTAKDKSSNTFITNIETFKNGLYMYPVQNGNKTFTTQENGTIVLC